MNKTRIMPNPKFQTVEDYIASFDPIIQEKLQKIRNTIQTVIPEAVEVISYNIPCFKFEKRFLIYYSAYKAHISIALPPSNWPKEFANELKNFKTTKSTIQFPYSEPLPLELISSIAKFRFDEKIGF
ncbi:MAG: iron chaperone [Patescibacteria group bacterium]